MRAARRPCRRPRTPSGRSRATRARHTVTRRPPPTTRDARRNRARRAPPLPLLPLRAPADNRICGCRARPHRGQSAPHANDHLRRPTHGVNRRRGRAPPARLSHMRRRAIVSTKWPARSSTHTHTGQPHTGRRGRRIQMSYVCMEHRTPCSELTASDALTTGKVTTPPKPRTRKWPLRAAPAAPEPASKMREHRAHHRVMCAHANSSSQCRSGRNCERRRHSRALRLPTAESLRRAPHPK